MKSSFVDRRRDSTDSNQHKDRVIKGRTKSSFVLDWRRDTRDSNQYKESPDKLNKLSLTVHRKPESEISVKSRLKLKIPHHQLFLPVCLDWADSPVTFCKTACMPRILQQRRLTWQQRTVAWWSCGLIGRRSLNAVAVGGWWAAGFLQTIDWTRERRTKGGKDHRTV